LKNYYDMLSVARDAPAEEIKKAFRREIARYHPDKVQHLGPEFQDMAAGIAADLTEAYRILMDPAQRAKYDADSAGPRATTPVPPSHAPGGYPPPPVTPVDIPPPPPPPSAAPRPSAGFEFVKRACLSKVREAIADVLGGAEELTAYGFDIALLTRPKKSLFKKGEESVCLLIKLVPTVDAAAIADVWVPASKVRAAGATGCVLILMGQGLAPARDLAGAVAEQRRRTRGAGPVLVPVDVRDWEALYPPETPGAVRSLIQRLKDDKR
jgi:curved DNA-binding protein CbpA